MVYSGPATVNARSRGPLQAFADSCPCCADPNYHEAGDTAESVDVANVRMTVQATLAAMLTLDRR